VCAMTNKEMSPTVLWAQRSDKVMVSIQLDEVTEEKVKVDTDSLSFKGTSGGKVYEVHLEFNNCILPDESTQRKGGREYYFELKKKDPGPFWPRLLKDSKKHQNIKVDFSRWRDESESDDDYSGGGGGKYDDASLEDMMQQMGSGAGNFDPGDACSDDSDDEDLPELEAESKD